MRLAVEASQTLPVQQICLALEVPRSTFYYQPQPMASHPPLNALSAAERSDVLATVNSERFCNDSPRVIVARLADEDQRYLCSPSSMWASPEKVVLPQVW